MITLCQVLPCATCFSLLDNDPEIRRMSSLRQRVVKPIYDLKKWVIFRPRRILISGASNVQLPATQYCLPTRFLR